MFLTLSPAEYYLVIFLRYEGFFFNFHKCKDVHLMKQYKIIVEKHSDGYIAYPLGLKGVVVGQGDTYEEVLADVDLFINYAYPRTQP